MEVVQQPGVPLAGPNLVMQRLGFDAGHLIATGWVLRIRLTIAGCAGGALRICVMILGYVCLRTLGV